MIAGTLGAHVLPRAGTWMDRVKWLFAIVFLDTAIWLIGHLMPGPAILALWAALLVGSGIFAGAMDLLPEDASLARRGVKTAGALSMLAGGIMAVGAALGGSDPLRPLAMLQGPTGTAPEGEGRGLSTTAPAGMFRRLLAGPRARPDNRPRRARREAAPHPPLK